MPQLSVARLTIVLKHLICTLGLLYLPATVAAQSAQGIAESDDRAVTSTSVTTAANIESPTSGPDPNAVKGVPAVMGYDDLLSADKTVRDRAFQALFNQIFRSRQEGFDFLASPEKLVSALSKTMLSDDDDIARMSTYVIRHIATLSGSKEVARERGFDVNVYGLSEHYQQFEKFGINDTLQRLAVEAEGSIQEDAIVAIYVQDVMSEKNDDLLIRTFRSPKTDDRTLSTLLVSLAGTVYIPPGENYTTRRISSELANALYELLSYDGVSSVRSSAAKVLAYTDSKNARDVVIAGLIAGPNDEVFERSLRILKQHNGAELKQDPRLRDVVNSLEGESRKKAYSEFLESLE